METTELQNLLGKMRDHGASDLILSAGASPRLRVSGNLTPYGTALLTPDDIQTLVHGVLSKKQIETLEQKRSLDFTRAFESLAIFRFNIYYQRNSLAMAIRMIPYNIPSFDELGLPGIAADFASRAQGLVLISGPAGSGKSTTVASMINHINHTRHVHIICIEDPIEYHYHHGNSLVDQREVGGDAYSFAEALRSVFRQSPDVVMVGEMRDLETIRTALTLAETGHLILATLHSHDTTHVVQRIVDVFPPGQQRQVYMQLALVLEGVIAQRLVTTRDGAGAGEKCTKNAGLMGPGAVLTGAEAKRHPGLAAHGCLRFRFPAGLGVTLRCVLSCGSCVLR